VRAREAYTDWRDTCTFRERSDQKKGTAEIAPVGAEADDAVHATSSR